MTNLLPLLFWLERYCTTNPLLGRTSRQHSSEAMCMTMHHQLVELPDRLTDVPVLEPKPASY